MGNQALSVPMISPTSARSGRCRIGRPEQGEAGADVFMHPPDPRPGPRTTFSRDIARPLSRYLVGLSLLRSRARARSSFSTCAFASSACVWARL